MSGSRGLIALKAESRFQTKRFDWPATREIKQVKVKASSLCRTEALLYESDCKCLESSGGGSTVGVWGLFVAYLFILFGQSLFTVIQKYVFFLTVLYYFSKTSTNCKIHGWTWLLINDLLIFHFCTNEKPETDILSISFIALKYIETKGTVQCYIRKDISYTSQQHRRCWCQTKWVEKFQSTFPVHFTAATNILDGVCPAVRAICRAVY